MERKEAVNNRSVIIIAFGHFMHDIFGSFLAPLMPLLQSKFAFSYTFANILTLSQRLPAIFNPVIALIAQNGFTRFFFSFSPLLTAVCMSSLTLTGYYWQVLALCVVAGISHCCFHVTAPTLMTLAVGSRRIGLGASFFMLGGQLSWAAGPLLIISTVTYLGEGNTWTLIFLGFFASLLLWFNLGRHINESIMSGKSVGKDGGNILLYLRQHKTFFLPLLGAVLGMAFLLVPMTGSLTLLLSKRGFSLGDAALAFSIYQVSGAVGGFLSGVLSDRMNRKKLLVILTVAAPAAMWFFLLNSYLPTFLVLAIAGFFINSTNTIFMALAQEHNPDNKTLAVSIYMSLNFCFYATLALIAGKISDWWGLEQMFQTMAAMSPLALLCSLLIPQHAKMTAASADD